MTTLRDAAQQALEALETVLSDAYHRRFPECCGRPGIECCGNPNEAWTPEDNKIMDLLSPAQRQLSDALRAALAEPAEQEPVAWPHVWGCRANAFGECDKGCTAPQPAAVPAEDAIEAAYWDFDARHKGYGPHKTMPQSERDAFKWAVRAMLAAAIRAMKDKT